jgi:hypothetical protein
MYSLFDPNNRFDLSPKNALSVAAIIIALVLTAAACQTTNDGSKTPAVVFRAIVYGKIHSMIAKANIAKKKYVFVMNRCTHTDSIQAVVVLGGIERLLVNQNEYRIFLHRGGIKIDSGCLAANLVSCITCDSLAHATFATYEDFKKGIDSILAGPKKFNVDFHRYPPYDSVRVDFFLGDSTKH